MKSIFEKYRDLMKESVAYAEAMHPFKVKKEKKKGKSISKLGKAFEQKIQQAQEGQNVQDINDSELKWRLEQYPES